MKEMKTMKRMKSMNRPKSTQAMKTDEIDEQTGNYANDENKHKR